MTFAEALALVRAAYALGLGGGEVEPGHPSGPVAGVWGRGRGVWWEASERLGLLHRARAQATRAPELSVSKFPAYDPVPAR